MKHGLQKKAASKRKPLLLLGVFLMLSTLLHQSCYVLNQAYYFLDDRSKARDIEAIEADPNSTGHTKAFISQVRDMGNFGIQELGLKATGNYTSYIQTEKKYIVQVVEAAGEFSITAHTWWFPFFGNAPYLGFYNQGGADQEAERLRKDGFDVWVRDVQGFSTLGIFKDPLYSFMEDWDSYRLASLIFHEQTHASLWIQGDFGFNENLASFIGQQGALEYMRVRFGDAAELQKRLQSYNHDLREFYATVAELRQQLSTLYARLDLDPNAMRAEKAIQISSFRQKFADNYQGRFQSTYFKDSLPENLNNAWLATWGTYTDGTELFVQAYQGAGGTIRQFLNALSSVPKDSVSVQQKLKELADH